MVLGQGKEAQVLDQTVMEEVSAVLSCLPQQLLLRWQPLPAADPDP